MFVCWAIWERSQDRLKGQFTSMVPLSSKGISELRMIRGDGNVFGFDDTFWVFFPLPSYPPSPLKMEKWRTLLNGNENVWHLIPVTVVTKPNYLLKKLIFSNYFSQFLFRKLWRIFVLKVYFPPHQNLLHSFTEIPESHTLISYVATLDGRIPSVVSGYHIMNLLFCDCHWRGSESYPCVTSSCCL